MKACPHSQRGITMVEFLAGFAVIAALVLATAPPLVEAIRTSRLRATARHVAAELHDARSQAIGSGWQYRIVGYGSGATNPYRNQYRVMARESPATAWPAIGFGPTSTGTLIVGDWIDIESLFPGIEINPMDSAEFGLTFNNRGTPIEMSLTFNPLQVSGEAGDKWLTVSAAGNVRVQ